MTDLDPDPRWFAVRFDARHAAKTGMPALVPVPVAHLEKVKAKGVSREQAIEWIEDFMRENPGHELVEGFERYISKSKLWDRAVKQLHLRNWEQVRDTLEEIVAIDPEDAAARFNLGAAYRNLDDPQAALREYEACEEVFGDEGLYHTNRGRTYELLGLAREAVEDYEEALKRLPGDPFALQRLVELGAMVAVFQDPDDPEKVSFVRIDEFRDAVRRTWDEPGRDAAFFLAAARAHALEGRNELAFEAAERAARLEARNPDPPLIQAAALIELGRLEEAEAAILNHLALRSDSGPGFAQLGRIQQARGQIDEARGSLEKAVELDANLTAAIERLVRIDAPSGSADAAERVVEPIARRHPSAWGPWAVLAGTWIDAGDRERAFEAFEAARGRGAGDEVLARYLTELGRAGRLREMLEIADEIGGGLRARSEPVRWNIAVAMKSLGRREEGTAILQALAEDRRAHPAWRRRAQGELNPDGRA